MLCRLTNVGISNEYYESIFNDHISAEYLLELYNAYYPLLEMKKKIQNKKRNREPIEEKDAYVSRAIFHILYGIKIILDNEKKDLEDKSAVEEARRKSIAYVGEIVDLEIHKRGDLYTHDKFFKEVSTNEIIKNYIDSKY